MELSFLVRYITILNPFNNGLGVRYDGDSRVLERPVEGASAAAGAPA